MYPIERSLVEHFSGRPFALIGVNNDENKTRAINAAKRERMTWRNIYDGSTETDNVTGLWCINGWPSLRLVDADGIICEVRGNTFDDLVESIEAVMPDRSRSGN